MPEIRSGARAILSHPLVYRGLRELLGLNRWLDTYISSYVRPHAGARILDIGCGTGEVVRYLGDVDYVGFDRHQPYIEHATHHFGDHGKFICADVADHIDEFENEFDIVMANGVLHHLDDELARRLFKIGHRALKGGGRMVTVDPCRYPRQAAITRFIVNRDRGQNVRQHGDYTALARSVFPAATDMLWHGFAPIPFSVSIVSCEREKARA